MIQCLDKSAADIENCPSRNDRFLVRTSFLEIYNERISDLLVWVNFARISIPTCVLTYWALPQQPRMMAGVCMFIEVLEDQTQANSSMNR